MFKKVLLTLTLLTSMSAANAGLLLEPYIGYSLAGDMESTTADVSYSGINLGGRLGYSFLGLMGGIDYSMQTLGVETKLNNGSASYNDDVSRNMLGVFVGYNFPILLRAWATLYLSGKMEGDDSPGSNHVFDTRDEYSGLSGYSLGVGFTGLPLVSVNLEYKTFEFDTYKFNGTESTTFNGLDSSEIVLSVSLPLDF